MKKAVVVGGSNGIGLAITKNLIEKNYFVYILDISSPDKNSRLDETKYVYMQTDLLEFDDTIFQGLSRDEDVNLLMITAGFGRVATFESLELTEIHNLLMVNAVATIKIIHHFYKKIKNNRPFYCGIIGSIAGWVSSPLFSVYGASKAALCRFIESVNIELEFDNTCNRILNVSPGSIKGTRFNGGDNNLDLIEQLANEIVERLHGQEELFIPEYEETYKGVLQRYKENAHEFGASSYEYKIKSGRIKG